MSDNLSPVTMDAATPVEKLASLKQLTMVTYILYALSAFTGFTGLVAIIINYVKREDTAGTIYASHFTWQIRTFWWSLVWMILGAVTVLIGVGFLILFIDGIWVLYRIVKGFLNWNDGKPMPV
ncbi:hypothetical protein [Roseateles sp.]|uniref:DUF4870 family protein n=1 Tax=Roseateles sp. TaxID=1971397 RepID=UPI0026006479|nr:hypothetical protein [Roseateles sp.]MBV8033711.1 hypothetical protein [Roseateles sp.]